MNSLGKLVVLCLVMLITCGFAKNSIADAPPSTDVDASVSKDDEQSTYQIFYFDVKEKLQANAKLKSRMQAETGIKQNLLRVRLLRNNDELAQSIMTWLNNTPSAQDKNNREQVDGKDVVEYAHSVLHQVLHEINRLIFQEVNQHKDDLDPPKQAVEDAKVQLIWKRLDENQWDFLAALELAQKFDVDVSAEKEQFSHTLLDQAETLSAGLSLAIDKARALAKSAVMIPGDINISEELSVTENRIQIFSAQLGAIAAILNQLQVDTSYYNQQIILSTGQVSSNILDLKVVKGLIDRAIDSLGDKVVTNGPAVFFHALVFLMIIFLAYKLSRISRRLLGKALKSARVPLSALLQNMLIYSVSNLIVFMGILVALSQVGFSLGPVLAGLGVAGFIVGFALQDSMSNFASGILILIYRPFDTGDMIEVGGVLGQVKQMSLVNTTIHSPDNQTYVIPNNTIWQGTIKNLTEQHVRRVDLLFGISYSDDVAKAERVLKEILSAEERVLASPEPLVRLHELADSSVNFVVRPWVKTSDYWEVYWAITRAVKIRFDEESISIPFPQRDVHHHGQFVYGCTAKIYPVSSD